MEGKLFKVLLSLLMVFSLAVPAHGYDIGTYGILTIDGDHCNGNEDVLLVGKGSTMFSFDLKVPAYIVDGEAIYVETYNQVKISGDGYTRYEPSSGVKDDKSNYLKYNINDIVFYGDRVKSDKVWIYPSGYTGEEKSIISYDAEDFRLNSSYIKNIFTREFNKEALFRLEALLRITNNDGFSNLKDKYIFKSNTTPSVDIYYDINADTQDTNFYLLSGIEYDITSFIHKLREANKNGEIPEEYTMIKSLLTRVEEVSSALLDAKLKSNLSYLVDKVESISLNELTTSYDKYVAYILDYTLMRLNHNMTQSNFKGNSAETTINAVREVYNNQCKNLRLGTDEQLKLSILLSIMGEYADDVSSEIGFVEVTNDYFKDVKLNSTASVIQLNTNGMVLEKVLDNAKEAVEYINSVSSAANNPSNILLYFDRVVKYQLAKVYGVKPSAIDSDDESDMSLESSSALESLEFTFGEDVTVSNLFIPGITLPKFTTIMTVNTENKEAYRNLYMSYIAAASWAHNFVNSDRFQEVSDIINSYSVTEAVDNNDFVSYSNIIKRMQAISSGLEYLGIKSGSEDVTPELKAILELKPMVDSLVDTDEWNEYAPSNITGEPTTMFFSLEDVQFNTNYLIGRAASATYIPMRTNTYDAVSVAGLVEYDFIKDFHYKYGFNRKALYIDTNSSAAVDWYISGKRGSLRVATLKDLLSPEKDIVLYIDDNQYNVKKIAEKLNISYNKMANTTSAGDDAVNIFDDIADSAAAMMELDAESIMKTGSINVYSETVNSKANKYGDETGVLESITDKLDIIGNMYDKSLLSDDSIKSYLEKSDYSELQAFAMTSAIYRTDALFRICQDESLDTQPVFISSSNLATLTNASQEAKNTIFNYLMLMNLEEQLGIDYQSNIDVNSPIFMDIYGNIVTESGLIVIPAMSNSTLFNAESYNPLESLGWVVMYNNGYQLPSDYTNSESYMSKYFMNDPETGTWRMKQLKSYTAGIAIDTVGISYNSEDVVNAYFRIAKSNLNNEYIKWGQNVYLITEVMRGAPIENIDYDFEGLSGIQNIDKLGIYTAYKLDELSNSLLSNSNGNSMLTLPNLAFIDGVEYVVVFGFKVLFAVMICILIFTLYNDAVNQNIGLKTMFSFIMTFFIFISVVAGIPALLNYSYYGTNKLLLQNETEYIAMLNLEKRINGKEIGVFDITEPESTTKLYLKLDEVSVPWYEILDDVLMSNAVSTMEEIYDKALNGKPVSQYPGVMKRSNGLYMDLEYLFDSSTVEYNAKKNIIYNVAHNRNVSSFYLPYFVMLDQLIADVNIYNNANNTAVKSYTTKVAADGTIYTTGLIKNYFLSEKFMETSNDVLGLRNIYGVNNLAQQDSKFTDSELEQIKASLWYRSDTNDNEYLNGLIDEINLEARNWVMENSDLLGKVSDTTFLKMMALSMSIEYNNIFGIQACKSIEIFDVDSKDIIRLSMTDRSLTMLKSSESFARFVYETSGTLGVILMCGLILIYFVSSLVKPTVMLIILASTIVSIIVHKLIMRDKNRSVEGYFITLGLLCGTNIIYAALLKCSLMLPDIGLTPAVSVIVQIIIQFVYMYILMTLTSWVLRDWSDMGFNKYQSIYSSANNFIMRGTEMLPNMIFNGNSRYRNGVTVSSRLDYSRRSARTGFDIYNMMKQRDEERNDN